MRQEVLNDLYDRGYYDYFYSPDFVRVYEFIASNLLLCGNVLDVGCWTGMLADALEDRGYTGKYTGVDLCGKAIDEFRGKQHSFEKTLLNQSWDVDIAGEFDGVYLGGVLYYIDDKQSFIDRYGKALIIIQDIEMTDLSAIKSSSKYIFRLDIPVNQERKDRQILIINGDRR